ncbi:MAG: FAD-linked oxidase C-terminal domain-containing protein, partial [bacterium]
AGEGELTPAEIDELLLEELGEEVSPRTRQRWLGELLETEPPLVERHGDLIEAHQPHTTKNASGYRLERVVEDGGINLSRLVCGSEGTLAVVVAAKLRVASVPAARRLALVHCPDVHAAGRAVLAILPLGPSAIEMHEARCIEVIRAGRPELSDLLPPPGASQLFVEFDADAPEAAAEQIARMRARVRDELGLATACIEPGAEAETERLWALRKATLPLLYTRPGPKRIVSFIEDVTVPPEAIPAYIDGLFAICQRHGVEAALYGHAAQGNFHTRPFLDLHDPAEVATMRAVADEVFDLALALHGTLSGEHGDGMARTEYLARAYGPLARLFAEVKAIFDPCGLMNPGKKVPDPRRPYTLTANLRFDPDYGALPLPQRLAWENGGPATEAERCHGCGKCRTLPADEVRMCPVFKALGLEAASPRAKANLLREIAAGRLTGPEALAQIERVADYCLLCGSCQVDCPSGVDVPKLMLEAKARAAAEGGSRPWRALFKRLDQASRLGAALAPLANAVNRLGPARWLLEKLAHVDRRRPLPRLARRPLRRRLPRDGPGGERQAVYFPDVFAELNDPSIGEALARLLRAAGIETLVPSTRGCGILSMCYGDVAAAQRTIRRNLRVLLPYAQRGLDVLVSEPTALLCLRETYGDFAGNGAVREVAARCHDAVAYLLALVGRDELSLELTEVPLTLGYHTPCHARAAGLEPTALDLLAAVPGLTVVPVDEGCCGIAGSAGLRREKYELSMAIGRPLFDRLSDGAFDGAITECSACRMQIEHGTGKPVYHPLHLLDHAAFGTPLPGPVAVGEGRGSSAVGRRSGATGARRPEPAGRARGH